MPTPYLDEYLRSKKISPIFRVGSIWIAHDSPFGSGAKFKITNVHSLNKIQYVYWNTVLQRFPDTDDYNWYKSVMQLEHFLNIGVIEKLQTT